MQVLVSAEDKIVNHGSVWAINGTEEETGSLITFAVDHGVMRDLWPTVEECGELLCYVEDWQVMTVIHRS